MLLESFIEKLNKQGYTISNLFQNDFGWQANLNKVLGDTRTGFEFGLGSTPLEALQAALVKTELSSGTVILKSKQINHYKGRTLDQNTINDILSQLNLGD